MEVVAGEWGVRSTSLPPARTARYSRTARYYSNPAEVTRYARGVVPVASRKAREKFDCDEKPADSAMSAIGKWRSSNICLARASRIPLTNSWGDRPVVV